MAKRNLGKKLVAALGFSTFTGGGLMLLGRYFNIAAIGRLGVAVFSLGLDLFLGVVCVAGLIHQADFLSGNRLFWARALLICVLAVLVFGPLLYYQAIALRHLR